MRVMSITSTADATLEDEDVKHAMHENVKINLISLRFTDSRTESAYRLHTKRKYVRVFRVMLLFSTLFVVGTVWRPYQERFWLVVGLKATSVALGLSMIGFFNRVYRDDRILLPLMSAATLLFLISRLVVTCDPASDSNRAGCAPSDDGVFFRALESDVGFTYLMLVGLGFFVGFPFVQSGVICLVLALLFICAVWFGHAATTEPYGRLQVSADAPCASGPASNLPTASRIFPVRKSLVGRGAVMYK